MTFSIFHHSLWAEIRQAGMLPAAQGLFLYLTFNSCVNPAGLYLITDAQIMNETGYKSELPSFLGHLTEISGGSFCRFGNMVWNEAIPENWKFGDYTKWKHDGLGSIAAAIKLGKQFGTDNPAYQGFENYHTANGKLQEYAEKHRQEAERIANFRALKKRENHEE